MIPSWYRSISFLNQYTQRANTCSTALHILTDGEKNRFTFIILLQRLVFVSSLGSCCLFYQSTFLEVEPTIYGNFCYFVHCVCVTQLYKPVCDVNRICTPPNELWWAIANKHLFFHHAFGQFLIRMDSFQTKWSNYATFWSEWFIFSEESFLNYSREEQRYSYSPHKLII